MASPFVTTSLPTTRYRPPDDGGGPDERPFGALYDSH